MKKWVNNMTPKEKSEFDKGIKEMKRMKGTRWVYKEEKEEEKWEETEGFQEGQ